MGTEAGGEPVPDFDGVPGRRQHGQVVGAEGQRAHVAAMAAQRQARRLARRRRLVPQLQAVRLHRVVLQQQRHLQLAAAARQAVGPPAGTNRSQVT